MKNDEKIAQVVSEAAKILRDYPELKYSEAINKANELDYVEVKESPKWEELKKVTKVVSGQVVTEDGEIVEGVEVVERPPVMEFKEE